MSSIALAPRTAGFPSGDRGPALNRRQFRRRQASAALPWDAVLLPQQNGATSNLTGPRRLPPAYVGWLAVAAILLHGAAAWYLYTRPATSTAKPLKHEVTVELERPKPPPKIEPPKPPPKQPPRTTQVLPQIETAAPTASVSDAVSTEPPVAAPPVAAPPAPPAPPLPVTAPFGRAGYLNNPPPEYPGVALRQGWQGTVILRVRVLSSGRVDAVEVQKSSGRKVLDDEAARTVKGWSFTPSKRGDTPIDGWATVPIEFKVE
jgi:protein TonB